MSTGKRIVVACKSVPLEEESIRRRLHALDIDAGADWLAFLRVNCFIQVWHRDADVWLVFNGDNSAMDHFVVSGLKNDREAKLLRAEFWRAQREQHLPIAAPSIERVAAGIVSNRPIRERQELFESALKNVRDHFARSDGTIIEGKGYILPISKLGLTTADVDLLRAVYERLPPKAFNPITRYADEVRVKADRCPTCGRRTERHAEPVKTRSDALRKLNEFHIHHRQDVFKKWVRARVVIDAESFTSSSALHNDYWGWAAKHGENRPQKRTSKDTRLNLHVWGRLMRGESFLPVRRATGNGYRVKLRTSSS